MKINFTPPFVLYEVEKKQCTDHSFGHIIHIIYIIHIIHIIHIIQYKLLHRVNDNLATESRPLVVFLEGSKNIGLK